MEALGLTGYASVPSNGYIGVTTTGVRIFDLVMAVTGLPSASASLIEYASGTTVLTIATAGSSGHLNAFNSGVGLQFPNGCLCVVRGTTATAVYIREF